ncbi:MAG: ElaA protein [Phenylobacterium sp.]|jgi:ElaA protein
MQWFTKTFDQLDINQLYEILKLRVDVFVVEQTCYYPELDDLDRHEEARHVFAYEGGQLIGYLRCLAPGQVYDNDSAIGRVVIATPARGRNLGHELIQQGIIACENSWPEHNIHMSAQEHLQKYYLQHGFKTVSEPYLEDDIPHISMLREITPST